MSKIINESLVKTGTFWFPEAASTEAFNADNLYNFILWGSVLLFIALTVAVGYFLYKYKRTEQNQVASKQITHHDALEITWTIIPLIITMFIFVWGYKGYLSMTVPPANATEIRVTAKKWMWQFEYPNGNRGIGELVVPVNTPIRLVMSSEDVIHSFYVPNFRIKRDVIPNRYTRIWFQATKPGNYQLFCTEFCGDGHSEMLGTIRVVTPEGYQKWLQEANSSSDMPLHELGEKVYASKGCNACHSLDGTAKVGPSWKGLYGATRKFTDGKSLIADDNYIRESIMDPKAKVVAGFQPVMPTFAGLLNDREVTGVIEYIKKLK